MQLVAFPWTVARQALLSMAFLRQEYWRGLPFPFPGDLSDSGMEPTSFALADGFFTTSATCEAYSKFFLVNHNMFTVSQSECIALKDGEGCLPGN